MTNAIKKRLIIIFLCFPFQLLTSFVALSQNNKECLECHSDKSLTMEKGGKTISIYVNPEDFGKSRHKDQSCVDCHAGYDAGNIPHKEKAPKVNCLTCHESGGMEKTPHGKNVDCQSCHAVHYLQSGISLYKDVDACLKCHNSTNITGYKNTKHYKMSGNKRIVSCFDCHGKLHTLISKNNQTSPVSPSKVANLCTKCHNLNKLTGSNSLHQAIFSGSDKEAQKCTNCHGAHNIVMGKASSGSKNCITCHLNKDWFKNKFARDGKTPETALVEQYSNSIHAKKNENGKEAAECSDCHGDHTANKNLDPKEATKDANQPETCGKCHKFASQEFLKSGHGIALKSGIKSAPGCSGCHSEHGIKSKNEISSTTNRAEQVKVCLNCHLNNPDVQAKVIPSAKFIAAYETSVHGIAYHKGNTNAAICSDCHGTHNIKKASEVSSLVNKNQIAQTCGKCHSNSAKDYKESIHGIAFGKGVDDSPTCTYCHGEHQIANQLDPKSPTSSANVSTMICAKCHNSVSINSKFDLSGKKFASYEDSYHGLATTSGDPKAANCASCHGVHGIKPSADPTSSIHKANLVKTCGKCHPGANDNFVKGTIHVNSQDKESGILYFISTSYILLILLTVGGMFLHNLLDFIKKSKIKLRKRRYPEMDHKIGHALYLRMTVNERIQHVCLLTSFITLVITGFMLVYPNAWWVIPIRNLSSDFFKWRGIIHRVAAVIMVGASFYHIYYVLFTERGKQLIKDLIPKLKDMHDAIGIMKFNLGMSKEKPKLDRFSYIEKAEYWALIWGTIVMTVSGLLLWFENYFLGITSKLFLDIATTIHYYEAWLAALSIVVWHFYFVIFNPDTYPINLAWIKGTLSEEEMYEEHPLELERIKEKEAEDSDND